MDINAPHTAKEYFKRAGKRFQDGDIDGAIADYSEVIRLEPYDAPTWNNRGFAWGTKGEYDNAIEDLTEAICLKPDYMEAWNNRGIFWRKKGEYDKSLADLTEAIRLAPNKSDIWSNRGNAWSCKGKYGNAIKDYGEALRLDPDNQDAIRNRARALLLQSRKLSARAAKEYLRSGQKRLDSGDINGAIKDYTEAIRWWDYFPAWQARGYAWGKKGEHDKAIFDHTKAIRLKPDYAPAWYARGHSWFAKGEFDNAIMDYSKVIRLNPNSVDPLYNRGLAWFEKGAFDKAVEDYTKALRLNPSDAYVWNNRGNAWAKMEKLDKALADHSEAVRLKPDYALFWYNRGMSWKAKGEYGKAIADFDEAIRLNPNNASQWAHRGIAWGMKGDHDKAIENFDRALHLDPNNRDAIRNRATALSIKKVPLHEMPLHDSLKTFGATKGQRQYVDAPEINSVGYDESSRTLEIEFRGRKVYRYSDVPRSVYESLMDAEKPSEALSIEDFFDDNIRGVYSYSLVGKRAHAKETSIRAVGYDRSSRTLEIEFPGGRVYQYSDVPASVCLNLMDAESMGDFFDENIRDVYSYFPVSEYVSVRKS